MFLSDDVIIWVFVLLHPCCICVFIIVYISDAKGLSAKKWSVWTHPKASQFHTIPNKFQNQFNEVFDFITSQTQTSAICKVLRKNGLYATSGAAQRKSEQKQKSSSKIIRKKVWERVLKPQIMWQRCSHASQPQHYCTGLLYCITVSHPHATQQIWK